MLQHLLSLVTLGSVCIAAIATYITVRHNSQQLGAQIFLAYSGRVRELRQANAQEARDIEVTLSAIFLIFELYEFRAQWDTVKIRLRNHAHFIKWVNDQLEAIQSSTRS